MRIELLNFFYGFFIYFILDMLKSYLNKKSENIAELEDSPLITKVTEQVKQEFSTQLSELNAQLSILTYQTKYINERSINSINVFFERCIKIIDLHSINLWDFTNKNLAESIIEYQESVEEEHRKLYTDYHLILLYHSDNKKLLELTNEIIIANDLIKKTFKKHFGSIKIALMQESGLPIPISYSKSIENSDIANKNYRLEQNENFKTFNKYYHELLQYLSKYFKDYGYKEKHSS